MDEELLGVIKMFAGNFNPRGYLLCQGQLLSIAQNTALFSILGTTFGGNGTSTFGIPDLRGRVPVGNGTGPGLSPIVLGEVGGQERVTLLTTNMPAHTHPLTGSVQMPVNDSAANVNSPVGSYLADTAANIYNNAAGIDFGAPLTNNLTIGIAGGSQPFEIQSPYLGMNYIIAVQGIFPSRD